MVLACLRSFIAISVGVATASSGNTGRSGFVSLPLVPHHEYQRRHRRSLSAETGKSLDDPGRRQAREEAERHRSHYARRLTERRLRRGQEAISSEPDHSKMQVAALFQGFGTHYADLWCGTPPQRQTVIVDTGSGVTAFPCSGCGEEACGVPKYHLDKLFSEKDSSTFHALTCAECLKGSCRGNECSIGMSYQEGSSWSAFEVQDRCYVGGLHDTAIVTPYGFDDMDPHYALNFAFDLKFGCQTSLTGLFKTQLADGIMGMDNAEASFWSQMSDKLGVKREFSLCFSRSPTASRSGTAAGAMTLGGVDERLHQNDMVFTDISSGRGFYNVHLRKIHLREGSAGDFALSTKSDAKIITLSVDETTLNRGSVIIDSGTTDTYFDRAISAAFGSAWKELVGKDYAHQSVVLTDDELHALPTILFQIASDEMTNKELVDLNNGKPVSGLAGDLDPEHPYDVILAVPASHFYEYDEDTQDYTARFYTDESGGSVLGANSMMGHDVYFDIDNKRIGWAESTCDYTTLVQPFLTEDISDTTRQQQPDEEVSETAASTSSNGETNSEAEGSTSTEGDGGGNSGENGNDSTTVEAVDESEGSQTGETTGDGSDNDIEGEISDSKQNGDKIGPAIETTGTDTNGEVGIVDVTSEEDNLDLYDDGVAIPELSSSSTSVVKPSQFCSNNSCKMSALVGMVVVVLVGLTLVRRRQRRTAAYEMAASELELQTRDGSEEGDFANIQYRDAPGHRYQKASD